MPKYSISILVAFAVVLGAAGLISGVWQSGAGSVGTEPVQNPPPTLTIASTTLSVEFADTSEERTQGLSGRTALPEDAGMLFVFPHSARHAFWMKDMRFPIDIIWISAQGRIVDIKHRARPESYPRRFTPAQKARYVLETNAGFAEAHDITTGTSVRLPQ